MIFRKVLGIFYRNCTVCSCLKSTRTQHFVTCTHHSKARKCHLICVLLNYCWKYQFPFKLCVHRDEMTNTTNIFNVPISINNREATRITSNVISMLFVDWILIKWAQLTSQLIDVKFILKSRVKQFFIASAWTKEIFSSVYCTLMKLKTAHWIMCKWRFVIFISLLTLLQLVICARFFLVRNHKKLK